MECCVTLKDVFQKHKKLILSLVIFAFTILVLGVPYTKWGFIADDFGIIWHSKFNNLKDFLRFFYEGSENAPCVFGPSTLGTVSYNPSFLSVLYRPLVFVFISLQHFLWGASAYSYLLFTVAIHAINAVMLFYLFSFFYPLGLAFWGSLLFAFHCSIFRWIGVLSCQKYPLTLAFLLVILILLKRFLFDHKSVANYFIACFLFFISLFFSEHLFFLPVFIFLFYCFLLKLIKGILYSSGFFLIDFIYLFTKLMLFPFRQEKGVMNFTNGLSSFIQMQKERFWDFVTYGTELLNLTFMSGGQRVFKGMVVIILLSIILYPFFRTKKFKLLIFLFISLILFAWPVMVITFLHRYMYVSIPVFIFIILFGINYYIKSSLVLKKYICVGFSLLIIFNAFFLYTKQREKEFKLGLIVDSFKELVENSQIRNKAICFIGLPNDHFAGSNSQAIWLYRGNSSCPVYYDNGNFVLYSPKKDIMCLDIIPIKNGFRLKSLDPENVYFCCSGKGGFAGFGNIIVNNFNKSGLPTDITYIFDSRLLEQKPMFVTWDYKDKKFIILNN